MYVDLVGLFENFQKATSTRTSLAEMGHQKPPSPVATNNTAATRIVYITAKLKKIQANDMSFYWIRYRIRQNHIYIIWEEKKKNWYTMSQYTTRYGTIDK